MESHIKHGIRLKNAYNQILYALKIKGLKEPELSIETSKAYIYAKIISRHFSSIIHNDKQYIGKNLKSVIENYKEGIQDIECYLHINKENNIQNENIKLVKYILKNTADILSYLTEEEKQILEKKLLSKNDKNRYITTFNRIYNELRKRKIDKKDLTKKTCIIYLYGRIGPIGFNSILYNEQKYCKKNLEKIINEAEEGIYQIDYYLLYNRNKRIKKENIEVTQKVYLEIINKYFKNLNTTEKEKLKEKLLKNSDKKIRFINAYNKIYYTLKKLEVKEPELSLNTSKIYTYIKLKQKGFDFLSNTVRYDPKQLTQEKIKSYIGKVEEIYYAIYEGDENLQQFNKILTQRVLESSGILNILEENEIENIKKLLLKNNKNSKRLVYVYNRIYYELLKQGMKEPKLTKEASLAYIYAKIAKCGFTEIQDNRKLAKEKIKKILKEYEENIKNIKFHIMNNEKNKNKKNLEITENILKNADEIITLLDDKEKIKLKEKLLYNANRKVGLINVYNRLYNELAKQGIKGEKLEKEVAKAYIYSKIGQDGFCDIRDNSKNSEKIVEKVINNYSERIYKIKYYLLDFIDNKNVKEADEILIKNILTRTKNFLEELYRDKQFKNRLNYNSQDKTKMITVYNKIYFELSKRGLMEPEITLETSKAFIYAKLGPEGFKEMQNNNNGSDEYVLNVIKYYKQGLEIIKQDYRNWKLDLARRVLYRKQTIRKRVKTIKTSLMKQN